MGLYRRFMRAWRQAAREPSPVCVEPFNTSRSLGRTLADFGIMLSCMKSNAQQYPVLDFAAGGGWISEFLARAEFHVMAFDIDPGLTATIKDRIAFDLRINSRLIRTSTGDGHAMPFADDSFGHILCFDSLHHMHDYPKVFRELHRILRPGGRAVFVEPGARHSSSPETVAYLKTMSHDPTWIERDIVLEEIHVYATAAGFDGLTIVPLQHPSDLMKFKLDAWLEYRKGHADLRHAVAERLSNTNYNERVVFYCDKL